MRRTESAKLRCWSANSSGVQTVASSVSSTLSSFQSPKETRHTEALRLSALGSEPDDALYRARNTVADATTRPRGLTPGMMDSLIGLAEATGAKLVQEAQASLATPMKRKNVRMLSCIQGIEVYANGRPVQAPAFQAPTAKTLPEKQRKVSLARSLWNRLTRCRQRPEPKGPTQPPQETSPASTFSQPLLQHVPRVFGRTQVHVPLDELIDLIGHRSVHAAALLHPSMDTTSGLQHSLIDLVNEHVRLRSVTLPGLSPTASETRDFLTLEYHHAFRTASGRRGYVIACHSVHWTQCPRPAEGAVRGSMYESGLVAIESEIDGDRVDLYSVAELNLKGEAGTDENFDASHRRVMGTLERLTLAIEERAKMLLSLDHTHVFHKARRVAAAANAESRVQPKCSDCKLPLGMQLLGDEPFACRKCFVPVCGDCSSIWTRGQKQMRLCMECWADATLNRTCVSVQDDSFLRFL